MKKFVKWFLFSLFVCGSLALAICYMVIPERTKSAVDVVIGYLNTPIGIAGGTTITIGLVAGVILKVVYDRYKDSVRNDFAKAKEYAEAQKEQAKGYYDLAIQEREQIREILSSYSSRIDDLLNKLVLVCETIPNAKVKALAHEIKDSGEQLKEELKEQLDNSDNLLANAIDKKSNVQLLEEKVASLEKQLERLVEQYGREERTND